MRHFALLLAAIATAISAVPASATIRISGDRGGLIVSYAERFARARASGERVVIDGSCLSACTLVIGILPREQVCATSRAVLGFHAAWRPTDTGSITGSPAATQAMYDIYPSEVRSWIDRRGGLTPRMIYLQGRELGAMVPSCGGGASAAVAARGSTRTVRRNLGPRVLASQPLR
jgi:hypothetical protein